MTDSKLPLAEFLREQAKTARFDGRHPTADSFEKAAALLRQQHEALVGLVGLTELLSQRDDLPAEVRNVLATSHRVIAAEYVIKAAAAAAEGEQS